jgi:hypothetical protein
MDLYGVGYEKSHALLSHTLAISSTCFQKEPHESKLAPGAERYQLDKSFKRALLSSSKAPMKIAAVTADLQEAHATAMPQVGEPLSLSTARKASAEQDAEDAVAGAFRILQELRDACSAVRSHCLHC